ncbi:beta-galactosidase [Parabacteroides sp. PF5-5]|uniref:beta-galactosidase n=1 Tax=unclassified Parabacteroides TaxID=2649774 RepID=UPI0024760CC2|nr:MULTISPECIES: beta-galactosidase [unclassified Parabacteroides]MDH6306246.1 beta-galactosidase [Parabacteroides sp. PH5-39]MDH6316962.1 beta-galactosidase [Parabacteroides sp. PF5-13]MDH6321032.1 beta-galactosidase [Parabacteroides sp. PH5-13]MDH6324764.1 beta-galactosidase [Parabacteroides sp. PH5-8]MDH6328147.1 beta-galactosidase [Parabacteroides sp. PH5-41]
MKNKFLMIAIVVFVCTSLSAQMKHDFFPKKNLTSVGAYYYPEHWDQSQWDRDLKKMAELGFEFTHFGEFAWAQLEPKEGKYDFAWLDKALELAAKHKLKVVLCTSTATPPVWLTRAHPEILIKNENGTTMDHGARQHASFSNTFYRQYSMKMIAELGKRYGNDPRVIGWQIDNEPGVRQDFNDDALKRFRTFLKGKYKNDINQLNKAWGTAFWSQIYPSFEMINFPRPANWGQNPHQLLDWKRFCAHDAATFLDEQSLELRKYCNDKQWITSNYIPNYDEGHIGQSLQYDFYTYTRYMVYGDPGIGELGFRIGDPMRIPYANDFFRPISGMYGVMELQPGQVNWGTLNTQPYPGAVRLWLWSVFAGGSDLTCTYRFRQPLYGDEQFHQAIIGPDGVTTSRGGMEFVQFINEINQLRKLYNSKAGLPADYAKRKVGILYNHENAWSISKRPLTNRWNFDNHIQKYYKSLKSFGAPVDVVSEGKDWSEYPILIAPAYEMVDDSLIHAWKSYTEQGGHLVLTCRTGMKDRMSHLFELPLGGKIYSLIGGTTDFYDLLPANRTGRVKMEGKEYNWGIWGDIVSPYKGTEVWANYDADFYKGKPAILHHKVGKGSVTYVGVDSEDGSFERDILKRIYALNNTSLLNLPEGVWMECRDGFGVALNYSSENHRYPLPQGAKIIFGEQELKPAGVLVWQY